MIKKKCIDNQVNLLSCLYYKAFNFLKNMNYQRTEGM